MTGTIIFGDTKSSTTAPQLSKEFESDILPLNTGLSAESGSVSVHWSIDASAAEPTIVFKWQERGGPPVTLPKRKGFGTVLLERAVTTSGTPPRFDYSLDGFAYEVRTTLAQQPQPE